MNAVSEKWVPLAVGLVAIYGGYFGAGASLITITVLTLLLDDELKSLIAVRQVTSFGYLFIAGIIFAVSGQILWPVLAVMAVGSWIGATSASWMMLRSQTKTLRWVLVCTGFTLGLVYLYR